MEITQQKTGEFSSRSLFDLKVVMLVKRPQNYLHRPSFIDEKSCKLLTKFPKVVDDLWKRAVNYAVQAKNGLIVFRRFLYIR